MSEDSQKIRPSKSKDDNLRLCVQNGFLHVKDVAQEAQKLSKSLSEPSICSSYSWSCDEWMENQSQSRGLSMESESSSIEPSYEGEDYPLRSEPRQAQVQSWSEGSKLHPDACSPCAWNWRASGCCNEARCKFCHMCPETALKERKKSRTQQLKKQREAHRLQQESRGETGGGVADNPAAAGTASSTSLQPGGSSSGYAVRSPPTLQQPFKPGFVGIATTSSAHQGPRQRSSNMVAL